MTTRVAKSHNIPDNSTVAFRSSINGAQLANYAERKDKEMNMWTSHVQL